MNPNRRYEYTPCSRCQGRGTEALPTATRGVVCHLTCSRCRGLGIERQESMDPRPRRKERS